MKTLVTMPIESETAKPLIGPVPYSNRISAVSRFVMLASSTVQVDLSKPDEGCSGEIRVRAESLDTGIAGRDDEMRKRLETAKHPSLRFEWTSFAATKVDREAQTVDGTARGTLEIRGVRREVAVPVHVSLDKSRRVAIEGELKLRMSDFGIKPPSQLGTP